MTLTQVWGSLIIFVVCPLLGGLPLVAWITYGLTGRRLARLGTGNISVSAAFYHGGRLAGTLAVLSEAFKGIAAVLLARFFFPSDPVWEVIALVALVMGRFWMSRGAGTTNVVWGYIVHDPIAAGLLFLISSIGFTILRERQLGKLSVLVLLPLITALRHPTDGARIGATVTLSLFLAWIYQKIPDDLDLPANPTRGQAQRMFRFFRGDRATLSLDQPLSATKVGAKAATLGQLNRWGYPVPMGWVLPPGDDPKPLIEALQPSTDRPLIVRSSAIGEDSDVASAAGQYESIGNVTSQPALEQAIAQCQMSYTLPAAIQYRQTKGMADTGMAVLIQDQVAGVFSGVAFSRDPITRQGNAVTIEALPGSAKQIVSGQATPEQYRVWIGDGDVQPAHPGTPDPPPDWMLPDSLTLATEGEGDVPLRLIQQVAYLARHIEARFHGTPQDIEWSYDGQHLWLLQSRPITTLLPIWTRKIAAEVIPGFIHPLTWSINRPLTCGVWGEIFTVVLGPRATGLDFNETATLHHSAAYFNASLLGQLFQRMGLPPESLEFLTRGAAFSKPPVQSTIRNVPGLLRLLNRELKLESDFKQDDQAHFTPGLADLARQSVDRLAPNALFSRIEQILELLKRATYYSILAPLSFAVRQAALKVDDPLLDNSHAPEVDSLRSLQAIAVNARGLLNLNQLSPQSSVVFAALAEHPEGRLILQRLDQFFDRYGYLSDVATDIAVPTWKDDPRPVRELFTRFLFNPPTNGAKANAAQPPSSQTWKVRQVQQRLSLKGKVTTVYSQLLAELRWSFVALEHRWLSAGVLKQPGDIFFLKFDEIQQLLNQTDLDLGQRMTKMIAARRLQLESDRQINPIPVLVYGNEPPAVTEGQWRLSERNSVNQLSGIGASPGKAEGRVLILQNLQTVPAVDRNTILVVPYTDSGWAPLLAQAGGFIAEAGGRLSHGAIIAREYGIPAVLDVHQATQQLRDGQTVRIDGQQGTVEVL
ncbi:glycerol-3-phosphate acyltransferase [Oculatella sp. LEGE 06141]|uniref:glycerol-3-phosphate acyltransferase n=1 Tax=Oculatella sp. LEGE 06141 TaxID=1828648 RepID=UPI00187E81B1|nr:glycerol-3-phosphate acyltransferase [Oculatella sp. LEGE 06141]MBE9181641.1 glycerol-3-phosphate acyltransferase [Oculatella sp. LEGE 06141]